MTACSTAEDLAENPNGVVEDTTALKELQRAGLGYDTIPQAFR